MGLFLLLLLIAVLGVVFVWKSDAIIAYLNSRNAKVNIAAVKADAVAVEQSIVKKPTVVPAPVVKPTPVTPPKV